MADKDYNINIKTKGNPEGAKVVRRELEAVETQAKAASSAAVEAVDYGQSPGLGAEIESKFRDAKEQAANLKEEIKSAKDESDAAGKAMAGAASKAAAFAAVVQILSRAGSLIREIGQEQRELNGEADDWVNIIGRVEDAVLALLDPVKLGYDLFSGYDALFLQLANKAQAHANKVLESYVDSIQKRREAEQQWASEQSLERKFKREKDAIDEQIRRLDRRNELTSAVRDSDDRVRDARDQTQIERIERGTGSDSQKQQEIANIKLAGINRDLTNQINELNDQLAVQSGKITVMETETKKLGDTAAVAAISFGQAQEALKEFETANLLSLKKFADAEGLRAQANAARQGGGVRATELGAGLDRQAADLEREGRRAASDPDIKSAADIQKKIDALKKQVDDQGQGLSQVNEAFQSAGKSLAIAKEELSDTQQKVALEVEALRAEAKAAGESILNRVKDAQKEEIQKQADDVQKKVSELGDDAQKARDEITDAAKTALKEAESAATEAQENGQRVSVNLRSAITKLNQILDDGSVGPEEMAKLESGLGVLKKSQEMVGSKVAETALSQIDFNSKILLKLDMQSRQLATQQAQINQLLSR